MFGDKWAPAILFVLSNGPLRRVDIASEVRACSVGAEWSRTPPVLHDSILARTLKRMTAAGLVSRTGSTDTFPPQAIYTATPEVVDLLKLLEPAVAWTRKNASLVERARGSHRRCATPGT
ncbi:winged helix-turn-helix transcriptional regulator [Actinoalloteichus caeruleus]|uniref:winged helix-turn-helix transcriptional regulator n=1 Tax=Actinoalloteichus cyanogriseus TaxID=2893586 RepID=UPI003AAC1BF6